MRSEIRLSKGPKGWSAKHVGPIAREIIKQLGTDTLLTAFTAQADAATVKREIERLNPRVLVTVEGR